MAYTQLKTNYTNDVIDTDANDTVKYTVVENEDETISLEDATTYISQGDAFGAEDINATNTVVNEIGEDVTTKCVQKTNSGNVSLYGNFYARPSYISIADAIDTTENPAEQTEVISFRTHDVNGYPVGTYNVIYDTSGNVKYRHAACKKIDGTNVWNNLDVIVTADGDKTYAVTNQENFRSAIGLGSMASEIRTDSPSTLTVTATSSVGSFINGYGRRYGKVVQLYITVRKTTQTAAGQNVYEGTLSSTVPKPIMTTINTTYYGDNTLSAMLTTEGKLTLRNSSDTPVTIASDKTAGISLTYITSG